MSFGILPFDDRFIDGVVAICAAEGWPSFGEHPELARKALVAPGVTTVVAVEDGIVIGFAEGQGDGVLQGHLSLIGVRKDRRRRGIARAMLAELFSRMGVQRLDLITDSAEVAFYESLRHFEMRGFRIYPYGDGDLSG